jgi:uncharacterized protein (TIGR00290 family)
MDFVGLISGGKDSIYSIIECIRLGLTLRCVANLHPPPEHSSDELDSWMFQSVGHSAIEALAQSMDVPVVRRATTGVSEHHGIIYSSVVLGGGSADEIDDLYELLKAVKARFPTVRGVSCGAILSTYQRVRLETVCRVLGLLPIAPLWQREQGRLLHDMVRAPLEAVLVKVASFGLSLRMLGCSIAELEPRLAELAMTCGLNVCGEGGEYETLVLDAPFFRARVQLGSTEPVVSSRDELAPVAHLRVGSCVAVPHPTRSESVECLTERPAPLAAAAALAAAGAITSFSPESDRLVPAAWMDWLQSVASGSLSKNPPDLPLWPASSDDLDCGQQCVHDTRSALSCMRDALSARGCTLADVLFVHLYVADLADFASINAAYCTYFGEFPPSRSCIQVSDTFRSLSASMYPTHESATVQSSKCRSVFVGGIKKGGVSVDCVALRGSGALLLRAARCETETSSLADGTCGSDNSNAHRSVLHVASLSRWAPLCLGPYSQANVALGLVWCAGQIGLRPESMRFVVPSPPLNSPCAHAKSTSDVSTRLSTVHAVALAQLRQSLLNTARVLAATTSALPCSLSVVLYVSADLGQACVVLDSSTGSVAEDTMGARFWRNVLLKDLYEETCAWVLGMPGRECSHRVPCSASSSGGDALSTCIGGDDALGVDGDVAIERPDLFEESLFSLGSLCRSAPPYACASEQVLTGGGDLSLAPVSVLVVPKLPRAALVEIEALCCTTAPSSIAVLHSRAPLDIQLARGVIDVCSSDMQAQISWTCHRAPRIAMSLWAYVSHSQAGVVEACSELVVSTLASLSMVTSDLAGAEKCGHDTQLRIYVPMSCTASEAAAFGAALATAAASAPLHPVSCCFTVVPIAELPCVGSFTDREDVPVGLAALAFHMLVLEA